MATLSKVKNIYSLERPVWMDAAGLSKGINHDRQHLGIILFAGQAIKVRQLSPNNGSLTLRLLNNDDQTEASVSFGSAWVTLSAGAASVPFIDTPYDLSAAVVEYEYDDRANTLPVYEQGGSESAFFQLWDSQNAEFALISSEFVNILIPAVDKQKLRTLHAQNSIDRLIEGYSNIFNFYNTLLGLSFQTPVITDRNIRNRYFIKADKSGPGAAYYSDRWTAETSPTVSDFWLFSKEPGWGCLHEIAHGYEGKFMSDRFIDVREVWNNIHCACYQHLTMGDRQYQEGWLYDYGRQAAVEKVINDFVRNGTPVNQWDLRSKLYFMMQMVNKAGMEAFTHFNQQYRLLSNRDGFIAEEHSLLDMLSVSFAEAGAKIDVTPFMQLVGAPLTRQQRDNNLFCQGKAVYPLNQLVEEGRLAALQQQLNLRSPLALVDVQQLKITGLTGSVSLKLDIDDFRQIENETLTLLDGATVVRQVKINRQEVLLEDLPVGVYTLHLPTGKSQKYAVQPGYLKVKTGQSAQVIHYQRKIASPLLNQVFNLLGLGDASFASVELDHSKGLLSINAGGNSPHVYFPDQTYAQITIRDGSNREIYKRTFLGNDRLIAHDEIAFSYGDRIEIYHREPSRLRLSPAVSGIIDATGETNHFVITASGLKNEKLNNNPETDLAERLESASLAIAANHAVVGADYAAAKDDLWLAVMALSRPLRDILFAKYYIYLSMHNELTEHPEVPEVPEVPEEPVAPAPPLYPLWEAGRIYVGGDRVTHKGRNYLAKWWIGQGTEPGLESTTGAADGDGRPWTEI